MYYCGYNTKLVPCPEARSGTCHSVELLCGQVAERCSRQSVCSYNFLHVLQAIHALQILLPRPPLSSHLLRFLRAALPALPRWMPQAGSRAGLGPLRGSLIRDDAPGGIQRGRPPQRLARALPCPGLYAGVPNVPPADIGIGAGTVGEGSGKPRTDGAGCGRKFVGIVIYCGYVLRVSILSPQAPELHRPRNWMLLSGVSAHRAQVAASRGKRPE